MLIKDTDMELQAEGFIARFSAKENNIVSIVRSDGAEYIKAKPKRPIISLYAFDGKSVIECLPGTPSLSCEDGRLDISYSEFGGYAITARLAMSAREDLLTVEAQVENKQANMTVTQLMLPYVGGIVLGQSHSDDTIIYPHHAGERTVNPVKYYGYEKKDFWRASSVAFEDVYRREINYCGLASMSWMYYYDEQNGFYIGSHDARFPVTGVIAETSGDENQPWMAFAFRKYICIEPGESYESGVYHIRISEKDWHYGAKLYSAYILPHLEIDENPAFLEDEYALNQCYNFKRTAKIENRFADIPKLYQAGAGMGIRHIFIASWNRSGFDADYPEYYPDMELGSAMEFRRGIEAVRKSGGFTTLYINARIFDVRSVYHATLGELMAVRDSSGSMIHEVYGPSEFTVNCPSDSAWQNYIIDTAEFAFLAYGCDGIYLDQLASAEPFPCYATNHSHKDSGQFNNGNVAILRRLLERLRKHNHEAYLMTENCGDIYSCHTWGSLTWNGAKYDEFYNVFKFTFPQFVQVNMVNPRGWMDEGIERDEAFFADMRRAVLLGSVLWIGAAAPRYTDAGDLFSRWTKKALLFRARLQQYIKNATYVDNAYVFEQPTELESSCWELNGGGYMILSGSLPGSENANLVCRLHSEVHLIESFGTGAEPIQISAEGATVAVTVPCGEYVCLILR